MSTYPLIPLHKPPAKRVSVPGSKSHTNRALLIAALAEGKTRLENALFSDDSRYFAQALLDLGFRLNLDPDTQSITLRGLGGQIPASKADLFIGNAGTAARFLTAMLTLGHGQYRIDGVDRMRQRPIGDLVTALNNLGASVAGSPAGHTSQTQKTASICPPVTIQADGLHGGQTSIRGDISSQFLSGLLMVSPSAITTVEILVDGPLHSKPYIDLTLGVMADFGVMVQRDGYLHFSVKPQTYHSAGTYTIESDASAASYFFAVPAICGGWVEVANISLSARQGDIAFLDVLIQMGCIVTDIRDAIRVSAPKQLRGVNVDFSNISDTFMTLAAIAPFAETPTTIRGVASSRVKETDRITATVAELRRLGVQVIEHPDGLTIQPSKTIQPAKIQTYDDHRIAMAFTLVGLRVPGIEIENPDCVGKTFPAYFKVLDSLR